jgi:cytochrome P450
MYLSTKNKIKNFYPAGNFLESIKTGIDWIKNPYDALSKLSTKHGSAFWLTLPLFGRVFVAGNPSIIEAIRKETALSGGLGMTFLRPVLGDDSVIMLHGTEHKCRRHLLAPLFNEIFLDRAEELTESYAQEEIDNISGKVSAHQLFSKINLRVITELLISKELHEQRTEISQAVERFLNSFSNPFLLFAKPLQFSYKGLTPWDKMQRNRDELTKLIGPTLEGHSVFSLLEKNTAIEEIIALILFGHETAASAGAWFIYHLLSNPKVKEALLTTDAPSRAWEAAVNESMRLCPTVVHLTRVATADVSLEYIDDDGVEKSELIRKGQKVLPCTYLSHHDPSVFPRPKTFDPSRFMNSEGSYRNSFYPFGFGTRICIGKQLAMRQIQIIASHLLKSKKVELIQKNLRPERNQVVIMPEKGCPLHIE